MGQIEGRLRSALLAWLASPVPSTLGAGDATLAIPGTGTAAALDVDAVVATLFRSEATSLVRLARLFVDDRNAAEDLVQEAFIRLARHAHRIEDMAKAPAYLRSIVLNLARDHNRRGLVSMRHRLPFDDRAAGAGAEDDLVIREDQRRILDALRDLPRRQQACLVLRYYDELGIPQIASTLGLSPNSVKTHLQRGLAGLEHRLSADDVDQDEDTA